MQKIHFLGLMFLLVLFVGINLQSDISKNISNHDLKQAVTILESLSEKEVLYLKELVKKDNIFFNACFNLLQENEQASSTGLVLSIVGGVAGGCTLVGVVGGAVCFFLCLDLLEGNDPCGIETGLSRICTKVCSCLREASPRGFYDHV